LETVSAVAVEVVSTMMTLAAASARWPSGGPAWLLDGRPLPYVEHSGPDCEDPDALIPVELVPGPMLMVAAGADHV